MYNQAMTTPLSNDALRAAAPSIFAEQAHQETSARYTYIPTFQIIEGMRGAGFFPVQAVQTKVRLADKKEFTKHMVKFVNADAAVVGDVAPQLLMINSHDGSSSYKLLAAMIRFICGNGLVVMDSKVDEVKVRHSGNIISNVIEGSFTVINSAKEAAGRAQDWRGIALTSGEREAFAKAASVLRFEDENQQARLAPKLLHARRREDTGTDLWSTFNAVQENVIKGGQGYYTDRGQHQRTRAVTGIDQNTSLNRALWRLAEEMKSLKAA